MAEHLRDRLTALIGGIATLAIAGLAYAAIGNIYSDAKAVDLMGNSHARPPRLAER